MRKIGFYLRVDMQLPDMIIPFWSLKQIKTKYRLDQGEIMNNTARRTLIIASFVLLSSFCTIGPFHRLSTAYSNLNELGQDKYEIIMDAPWCVKKGEDIPLLLLIHDADKAPGGSLPLKQVDITLYSDEDEILAHKVLEAGDMGDTAELETLIIREETWSYSIELTDSDFLQSGSDYIGNARAVAIFTLLSNPDTPDPSTPEIPGTPPIPDMYYGSESDGYQPYAEGDESRAAINETRSRSIEIVSKGLSSFQDWYFADPHVYSNYTETRTQFGAPIEAISRPGEAIKLDWIGITDNSSAFSSESIYEEREGKISRQNDDHDDILLLGAEEVICTHPSQGPASLGNYGKMLVYGAGRIYGDFELQGSAISYDDVLSTVGDDHGAAYISDYLSDDSLFSPWSDFPANATGMEIWKGGNPYSGTNLLLQEKWTSLLLEGKRPFAMGGSGAYGDFGRMGKVRLLQYIPGEITGKRVIDSLREGHTVITSGPLLKFTVENEEKDKFDIGLNQGDTLVGKEFELEIDTSCQNRFGEISVIQLHIGEIGENETIIELDEDINDMDITSQLPLNKEVYIRMTAKSVLDDDEFYAITNPIWIKLTNIAPRADAGPDIEMYLDDVVTFEGRGIDADGTIMKYEWDFQGDGNYDWTSTNTGKTEYQYEEAGIYLSILRVTDDGGLSDVDYCNVTITERIVNTPPRVDTGKDKVVEEGTEVVLSATVEDNENNVISMQWTEKGVILGEEQNLRMTFSVGLHVVTFTAVDTYGEKDDDTVNIRVEEKVNLLPDSVLSVSSKSASLGQSITFSGVDSQDPDGSIAEYNFIFGDGKSTGWQSSSEATHKYTKAGTFTAVLKVKDNTGAEVESDGIKITIRAVNNNGGGTTTDTDEEPESPIDKVRESLKENRNMSIFISALVVLIIIVIVAILIMRGRRKEEIVFKKVPDYKEERVEAKTKMKVSAEEKGE